MSLADSINKLKEATTSNNQNNGESAFSKLAHKEILRPSKRNPNLQLRILPPAQGKEVFFTELRQWGVEYRKKDGSKTFTSLNLKAEVDENDPLDAFINELRATNSMPQGRFGEIYPKKHFYVNVVPYTYVTINNVPQMQMQTDEQGLPDVYVLDLNKRQMESINEALSNPMNNPNANPANATAYNYNPTEEQKEWSFISDAFAYIVNIVRSDDGKRVEYKTSIQSNFCLAPLPQGWETKLEDLDALAEPSSTSNASWTNSVINQMKQDRAMIGGQAPVQAPTRPNASVGTWNQTVGQPQPQTTTSTTMPVYNQGGYVQQQPVYNQPTQQMPNQQSVQHPVQQSVQPTPVAPTQPNPVPPVQAQPAQPTPAPAQEAPTSPLSNFGTPLGTTTTTTTQAPAQAQQAPVSPTPTPTPAPASAQPSAPAQSAPDQEANDILASMGLNL